MHRAAFRAILSLPFLLLFSSCLRLDAGYVIHSQDSIDVTLDYGLERSVLRELGEEVSAEQLCSTVAGARPEVSAVVPYEDGVFVGCRMTVTSSLATIDGSGRNLSLADGVWTFRLSGADLEGVGGTGEITAAAFSDFRVSVTFPGEVLTHNGGSTVDGRRVTWTAADDLVDAEGLLARGRDAGVPGSGSVRTALYGGLAIAFGLLAALVAWLVRRARKQPAAAPAPDAAARDADSEIVADSQPAHRNARLIGSVQEETGGTSEEHDD